MSAGDDGPHDSFRDFPRESPWNDGGNDGGNDGQPDPGAVVACCGYESGRRVADLDISRCGEFCDRDGRFVWVGLREPPQDLLRGLQRQFQLHDLAIEDAFRAHQRPKVEVYGDSVFIVLRTARLIGEAVDFGETHVFAGKGYVISVRHGDTSSYGEVRARAEAMPKLLRHGEDFVVYAIMDFVVDNYTPIVDSIERQADDIEDAVQKSCAGADTVWRIAALRRDLLHLRRVTAPLMDVCTRLRRMEVPFIDAEMRPYFQDVHDHVIRVNESIDILRDMLDQTFDTHLLLAANRQGDVMRQLAGWAAILAVPTAIAGIYGMNFDVMPELHVEWGYPVVLAFIAVSCVVLYLWFRRIGWL
ncbi:MAG: magnesium/cobalt transporter CorA [Rhodospirillales bacterium]|nr:magnesium/cobalt transporter CorA [Rhodospirillales bacterium]